MLKIRTSVVKVNYFRIHLNYLENNSAILNRYRNISKKKGDWHMEGFSYIFENYFVQIFLSTNEKNQFS